MSVKQYFSHDYTSRSDPKIKALLRKYSWRGYGFYWAIVEDLYINNNSLPADFNGIADDYREDLDFVKEVICDFDLFCIEDGAISNDTIEERMGRMAKISKSRKKAADIRWGNRRRPSKTKAVSDSPPTKKECIDFFVENGYTEISGERFYNTYSSNDWKDTNGRTVKNWKMKAHSVWFKPENKSVQPRYKKITDKEIEPKGFGKFAKKI